MDLLPTEAAIRFSCFGQSFFAGRLDLRRSEGWYPKKRSSLLYEGRGAHCVPAGTPARRTPRRVPAAWPPERAPPGPVYEPAARATSSAPFTWQTPVSQRPGSAPVQFHALPLSSRLQDHYSLYTEKQSGFEPLCLHIDSVIYRIGVQARSRISSALSMEVMRPRRMYRSMKSFRVAPVNSSERPNCRELLIMMFIS
mgnify:CR=1 FL=1